MTYKIFERTLSLRYYCISKRHVKDIYINCGDNLSFILLIKTFMFKFSKQDLYMKRKYKPLPEKLVRDKIPGLHEKEFNVTVQVESARKWPLKKKEELLVTKLREELAELFAEYAKGDIHACCREVGDVLDVIDAIKKYVNEFVLGKGRFGYSGETLALIHRADFFIKFLIHHFNNGNFEWWIDDYRKLKKRKKGLFTELLVVIGEKKNSKT
jgi:predicted house-cleaning noncanonical NTP pyrophosphatase (MazG superfamily)